MDNEKQLQKCEAEREYQAANGGFDVDANDEFDNPQYLIDEKVFSDERISAEHRDQCSGCAFCSL